VKSKLYAILDTDVLASVGLTPLDVADAWLDAGVRLIQLRAKSLPDGPLQALADALVDRVHAVGGQLLINDRADIATLCRADGVHVGQDDLSPADVRRVVGRTAAVGLSTHDAGQVERALAQPISYLAIGPVFATQTKNTGCEAVGPAGVRRAAEAACAQGVPVVAIGGITRDRAAGTMAAGANALAVISDLVDPASAAACGRRASDWLTRLG
jgi:thiamine-phosphate pyrophosphorylase